MTKQYNVFDSHSAITTKNIEVDGVTVPAQVPTWIHQFVPVDGVGGTINWIEVGKTSGLEPGTVVDITITPHEPTNG